MEDGIADFHLNATGGDFQWAVQQEDRNRLWTARHRAYYANVALRPGCRSVTTDVCVPISALPEMIRVTKEDIAEHGLLGPMVGHVGDGNFHTMLLFDPDNVEEKTKCKEVANRMARRALSLGGLYIFCSLSYPRQSFPVFGRSKTIR